MECRGVFAPIPTPFEDERVDLGRLRTALTRWVATPLAGFVVLGSNGEAVFLDEEESNSVVAEARQVVPTGRLLIVGTGRESTSGTIAATKRAAALGADAVLVRTPGFFKAQMTADAFVRHYTAVADASPVPVLLYNFTAVTGVNLPLAAVSRLASHPNIIGMKESGSDVAQIAELVSVPSFCVLAGSTASFYPSLCLGARGGILAVACVLPDACVRLYELTMAGQHDEARRLHYRLLPAARLLGSTYGVPGLKAALQLAGWDVGLPRLPLMPLSGAALDALRDALAGFNVGVAAVR